MEHFMAVAQKVIWFLAAVFICGMFLQPYVNLPERVMRAETAIQSIEVRLHNSEKKLDQIICLLEKQSNPIGCTR